MLIVLEGIDAAGKATQTDRLVRRLEEDGRTVTTMSFPRYGHGLFADAVAAYLNGRYGSLESIDPHFPALLFAGDRFEHRGELRTMLEASDVVVLDRYVCSNLAYQGARVKAGERAAFLDWLGRVEFEVYDLPRPSLNIWLRLSPATADEMLRGKAPRRYTDQPADLHEQDRPFIACVDDVYEQLVAERRGGPWAVVHCQQDDGSMRSIDEIADAIWLRVQEAYLEG